MIFWIEYAIVDNIEYFLNKFWWNWWNYSLEYSKKFQKGLQTGYLGCRLWLLLAYVYPSRKNKTSTSKFQKTQILKSTIHFNTKMIKVKKQNPPMHKSFENILNVLPSNKELHHSFNIINNMTYEKIRWCRFLR
jgi:hypothetical protein